MIATTLAAITTIRRVTYIWFASSLPIPKARPR